MNMSLNVWYHPINLSRHHVYVLCKSPLPWGVLEGSTLSTVSTDDPSVYCVIMGCVSLSVFPLNHEQSLWNIPSPWGCVTDCTLPVGSRQPWGCVMDCTLPVGSQAPWGWVVTDGTLSVGSKATWGWVADCTLPVGSKATWGWVTDSTLSVGSRPPWGWVTVCRLLVGSRARALCSRQFTSSFSWTTLSRSQCAAVYTKKLRGKMKNCTLLQNAYCLYDILYTIIYLKCKMYIYRFTRSSCTNVLDVHVIEYEGQLISNNNSLIYFENEIWISPHVI